MRRGWAKCCRCGGWAGVMSLQPQEQHAVLLSVPHCLLILPSRVPVNQSHWLIAGFPMVLWSLVSFFALIVGYPKSITRNKSYTLTGPCPKLWVLLSARCAIFCCFLICVFLLNLKNMPTHCLGAACQSEEMIPGAMNTPCKVLFWDQASAWVTALIHLSYLKICTSYIYCKSHHLFSEMRPTLWERRGRGTESWW